MSMLFEKLENYGCEEAAFFCDKESGLKAIIVMRRFYGHMVDL